VAGGSYGNQDILYDASKEGASANVIFQPANGASVSVDGISFSTGRGVKGGTHVTIHGPMALTGTLIINGCGQPSDGQDCVSNSGGNYLDFDHLTITDPYGFVCSGCDHVSLSYSTVQGAAVYNSPCVGSAHPEIQTVYDATGFVKAKRPNHITLDHDLFQNFARCTNSDHTECLQTETADDLVISNSVFRRCDTVTVLIGMSLNGNLNRYGHPDPADNLIENNFFDYARDATSPSGVAYFSLRTPECDHCIVRYNSFGTDPQFPNSSSQGTQNLWEANVGPLGWCQSPVGTTFSYNVWQGSACSPTDRNVSSLGFVNLDATDLHLTSSSPAINAGNPSDYPATDIDGEHRPRGSAPDAGADEFYPRLR
jgi:hypothetical protein